MIFKPPSILTVTDIWVAGLILASLVWIEAMVIVKLAIRLKSMNSSISHKCKNYAHKKRGDSTNLPKE